MISHVYIIEIDAGANNCKKHVKNIWHLSVSHLKGAHCHIPLRDFTLETPRIGQTNQPSVGEKSNMGIESQNQPRGPVYPTTKQLTANKRHPSPGFVSLVPLASFNPDNAGVRPEALGAGAKGAAHGEVCAFKLRGIRGSFANYTLEN